MADDWNERNGGKTTISVGSMELKRSKKSSDSDFQNESAVLRKMNKKFHFVEFVDMGVYYGFCFIVMQLLGPNLSQLRKMRRDNKFSTSTSLRLSLQCFEAIESLHEVGLIHRDIKPTNFAIGCNETNTTRVYLLDFGLVRRYLNSDGTHRKSRGRVPFRDWLSLRGKLW
uniref:Protein kinase domain-containing protein n=1 Tax=Romanomermis culicivorax TaxID=13658 RepID=A0A915K6H2_ROMCU